MHPDGVNELWAAVGGGGGENNLSELGAKQEGVAQEKIINASKKMEVMALIFQTRKLLLKEVQ